MEITEVRIKLVEKSTERLRAFCSVTLDGDFVVRDLKVIDGTNGPFVAMPSRKLMDRCPRCGAKNHLRARFCNECGNHLNENRAPRDGQGRSKLHADVAHPINSTCRERIQEAVVKVYEEELERAKSPDYKPSHYDDYDDFEMDSGGSGGEDVGGTDRPQPAPSPSPAPPQEKEDAQPADHGFGDYNELIADLKRQAETRRGGRVEAPRPSPGSQTQPSRLPSSGPSEGPSGSSSQGGSLSPAPPPSTPSQREDRGSPSEPVRPVPESPSASDDEFGSGL